MVAASLFFRDLAYIFIAAVVGGILARKLKQPLILGYVLGGILISPFTPGPSVSNVHSLELFAEVGVILLMFSIGIQFHIRDLLRVKWVAVLGGTLGICASMLLGLALAGPLGWTSVEGIVIGSVVSVASTMVLARFLLERGELRTQRGRVMIAITLFEDIAVVILTVVLPTFGSRETLSLGNAGSAILSALVVLIPLGLAAAKFVPLILRRLVRVHSQELFVLVILALCLGTAALTQAIGLSLALGAFVAGLVLSGSDYAREALGNLLPLRDAFVALFFVTLGLLIDPRMLISNLPLLGLFIVMIVLGKALIWTTVVKIFGYPFWAALGVALGLTQIGEFSFILVQVARGANLVGADVYNATLAASLITIVINAAIWRYAMPWVDRHQLESRPMESAEAPALSGHIIVCGFGRMGGPAGAAFDAFGIPYVVLEINPEVVREARERGIYCLFGDPANRTVLEGVHVAQAAVVLVTLPEVDRAFLAIRNIRALNPHIPVLARAHRRADYELLRNAGATTVVQPETEAAATMIAEALEFMRIPEQNVVAYVSQYRLAMEIAERRLHGTQPALPELGEVPVEKFAGAGKRLKDSGIHERFGLTVVRVTRTSGETIFNPTPETLLVSGDVVHVLGTDDQLQSVNAKRPR